MPTQVKTRKAKATIVRTITLRPRMAGRNRACRSTAKTSHMPRALTTLGSVQLRVNPVPGAEAAGLHAQDHADQEAEREQGEGDGDGPAVDSLGLLETRQR